MDCLLLLLIVLGNSMLGNAHGGIAGNSGTTAVSARVDMMELNHCYDIYGQHKFDQVIFWERHIPVNGQWLAMGYVLVDINNLSAYPQKLPGKSGYWMQWRTLDGHWSSVRSERYRETWTIGDPERQNTRVFPEQYRLNLNQRNIE